MRRELTSDEIVDLYREHEAEITPIWEQLADAREGDATMGDAVREWLRRNPDKDPRNNPGNLSRWWLSTKIKAALIGRLAWEVVKNLNPFRKR